MSPRPDTPTPDPAARREEMDARVRRLRRAGVLGTIAAVGAFTGLAAASHGGSQSSTSAGSTAAPASDLPSTQSPSTYQDDPYGADGGYYADPGTTQDDSGGFFQDPSSGSSVTPSQGGGFQGGSHGS